jgi:26S proteasome regulatory subunit N10
MLLMENLLPPCYRGLKSLFLGSGLQIGGEANLTVAIQVAQLALKDRQNKQQQQRIIVFVGRYSLMASVLFY